MSNVIQLEPYRAKRLQLNIVSKVVSLFTFFAELFMQYIVNPIIAVRETIRQKRIVIV